VDDAADIVTIERPVAGGWMLARHGGRTLLVSGAIPGERVRVAIRRTQRGVAWGRVVEVIEASPDRRSPSCDLGCGGSLYAHIAYERQLQLKSQVIADAFHRIGKIDLTAPVAVAGSPERGYRLRGRVHVRGGRAGFFLEGTHDLCDAASTGQLHDDVFPALTRLAELLGNRAVYCDAVIVSENVRATQRILHLVARAGARLDDVKIAIELLPGVTGLTTDLGKRQVSLGGDAATNDSADELFLDGPPPIDGAVRWSRSPASFFQANRFMVGRLVRHVLDAAPGDRCVDLYSGVGLFAVALAARGGKTLAVEGDVVSARDLMTNAEPFRRTLRVAHAAVESFVQQSLGGPPDVVVLDPPRTGASTEVASGVIGWHPARIVYVSCDPPTLARDVSRFAASGYELHDIRAFDLFPNTPHVETIVVLVRQKAV
jgi:23S rRNA (uracil1939-C5)-methyltransferase